MTQFALAILGVPFALAGFFWEWIVRCFLGGREFFKYLEDL